MVEEANKLTSLIRELGQKTAKEMKVISHEFSISVEEMEKFVDGLTDGDLQKVLERIAVYYVPDPEEIKKQVLDLSKGTPLHSLIPITITDWEGRPIAKVGSIED